VAGGPATAVARASAAARPSALASTQRAAESPVGRSAQPPDGLVGRSAHHCATPIAAPVTSPPTAAAPTVVTGPTTSCAASPPTGNAANVGAQRSSMRTVERASVVTDIDVLPPGGPEPGRCSEGAGPR
jgi:hypothetical protein